MKIQIIIVKYKSIKVFFFVKSILILEVSSSLPCEIFPHLNFRFQKILSGVASSKILIENTLVPNRLREKRLALSQKELALACIEPIDDGITSRGDGLTSDGDSQIACKLVRNSMNLFIMNS